MTENSDTENSSLYTNTDSEESGDEQREMGWNERMLEHAELLEELN